jgi:outer membrane protein
VNANATSENLGDTDNALKLHSGYGLEFDATLMFSDRFGVELSAGVSAHRLCISGGDLGDIDAGRVWLVPVTAIAQYHHPVFGPWDPYIGLGLTWGIPFFDLSQEASDAGVERLELEGGPAIAAQIGVNYQLDNRWYANIDLRYTGTSFDSQLRTADEDFPTMTLDAKPLAVSLGFGYRF